MPTFLCLFSCGFVGGFQGFDVSAVSVQNRHPLLQGSLPHGCDGVDPSGRTKTIRVPAVAHQGHRLEVAQRSVDDAGVDLPRLKTELLQAVDQAITVAGPPKQEHQQSGLQKKHPPAPAAASPSKAVSAVHSDSSLHLSQ